MSKNNVLRPQKGPQETFMNIPPEVPLVFYGGAATESTGCVIPF